MASKINKWTPQLLSIARIIIGFLVVWHGMLKLFGYPQTGQQVPVMSLLGLAGLIEFAGGLLVMLGLFTRPVATVIGIEMAISYVVLNLPKGFLTLENDGEAAFFYTFFFLFLAAAGAGAWGLDRLISRKTVDTASQYFASARANAMLGLMRIAMAFMFFQHGTDKFAGYPGGQADHAWSTNLRAWGGLLEFVLSPLFGVGLFTRPIVFLLSGEMAVAYFVRWARLGILGGLPRGEASIYFCWAFLLLFVAGGGSFALDNVIGRKRAKASPSVKLVEAGVSRV